MAQEEREVNFAGMKLSISLTKAGAESVFELRTRMKGISITSLIRQAFRILDIVTDLLANGEELLVREPDGEIRRLNLDLDVVKASNSEQATMN